MDILLYLLILIIPLIAQLNISSTYGKYKLIRNEKGITGQEVARRILDLHGLDKIYVVETPGNLSDHYDSSRKVVRLSPEVFNGETIAAISIAAHECGHAIQDKEGYFMMRLRSLIYPIVNIGTKLSYFIILLGLFFQVIDMIMIGIALVSLGLIFQLVTLPVEFDASKRALKIIEENNFVSDSEHEGCNKMLKSAAMTYVAGVLASALEILRLILIFNSRNRD